VKAKMAIIYPERPAGVAGISVAKAEKLKLA
jgi:hypothetical protein